MPPKIDWKLTFAASTLRLVDDTPRGFHVGDSSFSLVLRNSLPVPLLMQSLALSDVKYMVIEED
jgi:hypothetical protein